MFKVKPKARLFSWHGSIKLASTVLPIGLVANRWKPEDFQREEPQQA
jgi:hypothetical protein